MTSADQSPPQAAAPPGAAPAPDDLRLCAFWLEAQRYALDVALVGEVVEVEAVVPVPRSPAAVQGLFNLRGEPVALLDLLLLLGVPASPGPARPGPRQVVVVRAEGLVAAFAVDRLEAVVAAPAAGLRPAPSGPAAHLLLGFLDAEQEPRRTLSVLSPAALLERLRALSFAGLASA